MILHNKRSDEDEMISPRGKKVKVSHDPASNDHALDALALEQLLPMLQHRPHVYNSVLSLIQHLRGVDVSQFSCEPCAPGPCWIHSRTPQERAMDVETIKGLVHMVHRPQAKGLLERLAVQVQEKEALVDNLDGHRDAMTV